MGCNLLRVVCSHKRNIAVARNGKRIHHPVATMSYWGKPSTPMNECEPDYANSPYVAEFWSALGDLVILAIAARGLVAESNFTRRAFAAVLATALCSLAYHLTLH